MRQHYLHLNLPRRGRFYFAFGVGLLFWQILRTGANTSVTVLIGLCFFLSAVIWLCFRDRPAGMEITQGQWRFFVGPKHWSVPLGDIAAVKLERPKDAPQRLVLHFRDGHTDTLPPELATRLGPLKRELARRGIPFEA